MISLYDKFSYRSDGSLDLERFDIFDNLELIIINLYNPGIFNFGNPV